jgi:NNMT/PNMT/TEMT family
LNANSTAAVYSDFDQWNAKDYLREYYSELMADERFALEFLVDSVRAIGRLPLALDVASGPCVHHVFPLVPKVSEVHLADFVSGNREEIRLWLERSEEAHDWTAFTAETLRLETGKHPNSAQVRAREQKARSRITEVLPADIRAADPLGPAARNRYPLVTAHYCAEAISTDRAVFRSNIHNIASLVAPGGTLIVSACGAADHYKVGDRQFPSSRATPEDVLAALQREGFGSLDLRVRLTPAHTAQGYSSVIFARGARPT